MTEANPTEIHFATNRRQPHAEGGPFGNRFHTDGPHFFEVGRAQVTWRDADIEKRDWDRYEVTYELEKGVGPRVRPLVAGRPPELHRKPRTDGSPGSAKLFRQLRGAMRENRRDLLVYIHGFANDFDNAMARAAQLKERYRITPNGDGRPGEPYAPYVFAFSWPADGKVQPPWKYASDREDAALSGVAMARALRKLVDFLDDGEPCGRRLHLVAHSMGNWALRHAVLGLRALMDEGRLPKIFDNVFLMAADEDEDCFERPDKLAALTEMAGAVHVYHSRDDLALKLSDATKGNMDRLGANGPRSFSGLSARITAIDCRKVDDTGPAHGNHQYYRLRREVIEDVRQVLNGRLEPDEIRGRQVVESGRRYRIATERAKKPRRATPERARI